MTPPTDRPTALAAATRALARIAERDGDVRAWAHVDADWTRAEADRIDRFEAPQPLRGLTLGVKDIIDVGGMPTTCGSPVGAGRIAHQDAALVAQLRALGALVIGKTVTTEFAYLTAGLTRNPHDLGRSPGGSSSGSAAAVADGHVDAALGSQTAGSIIRPAAFCGVFGYKPTLGRLSLEGVKSIAPSLDAVGFMTCDAAMTATFMRALGFDPPGRPLAFALLRGPHWDAVEPASQRLLERAAAAVGAADNAFDLAETDAIQGAIMRYEMRRELSTERLQASAHLSDALRAWLDDDAVTEDAHASAIARRDAIDVDALFGGADVLITPAALGEAPAFGVTGDPRCNRVWTLLGLPCAAAPVGTGPKGLPLGVQLVARRRDDAALFAAADALAAALAAG